MARKDFRTRQSFPTPWSSMPRAWAVRASPFGGKRGREVATTWNRAFGIRAGKREATGTRERGRCGLVRSS